jgi:hypothetical protein
MVDDRSRLRVMDKSVDGKFTKINIVGSNPMSDCTLL